MATRQVVQAADGAEIAVRPRSICLHGDTDGAITLARAVRQALQEAGVRVAPFA
jgi:UPF0271 protein